MNLTIIFYCQEALRLLVRNRQWAQNLHRVSVLLLVFVVLVLGSLVGLTAAAVDLAKDTIIRQDQWIEKLSGKLLQVFKSSRLNLD